MKNYTVTVNGNVYEVVVEEGIHKKAQPVSSVIPKEVVVPTIVKDKEVSEVNHEIKETSKVVEEKVISRAQGNIQVKAPMPGKILSIKVAPNQEIKKGNAILILEAMKMENEIVAPQDGRIASINVGAGDSVESDDLLATLD